MVSITLLTLVAVAGSIAAVPFEEYKLEFVTYVHRHGDRSPVGSYPNDPYGNESLWNNGWGQLTNTGKQTAFSLGLWMRERYNGFLPKIYKEVDYEVRSTDVSRTLMSAYLVLAGLYQPTGSDVWSSNINWQPIPVHTTPRSLDKVLAAGKPCPRHTQLLSQLMETQEMKDQLAALAPALAELAKFAGFNSTTPLKDFLLVSSISDSLVVQNQNGYPLPKWALPYFPKPLTDLTSLYLRLPTYNRGLQRLSCGLLAEDILKNLKSKATGSLKKKMWQYSAHDITIVGLRNCFNLNMTDTPPYASALIVELHSKNGAYFVRLLYKANKEVKSAVLPGCVENCPLEKFEELLRPIIPEDWEAECRLR